MSKARRLTAEDISALLKIAPRSNEELRTLTGFSRSGVSKQLERMELAGLAHRRRKEIHRAAGYQYMWHIGPNRNDVDFKAIPLENLVPGAMPKQRIVSTYPSVNRRDYLVAALFGQAGGAK